MLSYKKLFQERLSGVDPVFGYIAAAAFFTFLGIAFGHFGSYAFNEIMIVPCVLFLAAMHSRPIPPAAKKLLFLSFLMLGWFTFLQIRRSLGYYETYSFAPYFCTYLFAFPLATLMQDGNKKRCLKLFSLVFIAASISLTITGVLLILDWLPDSLRKYHVLWDGARLNAFWHPNMVACLLMFGIASCLGFLQETKKIWVKLLLLAAILFQFYTITLTNSRTIMILTSVFLGGTVFFSILKGRWKRAIPCLIVACALIVLIFANSSQLFQSHQDNLTEEFEAEGVSMKVISGQHSLIDDLFTFNSRTWIWEASFMALQANRANYIFGVDNPGRHMSYFCHFPETHTHNSWIETLLGLGIPGFAIAMVFTLLALWNSLVILLKHSTDVWKRNTALLVLCMMVVSIMEPYLFLPPKNYEIFNFIFFLYVGYLAHWQEEDNRKVLQGLRKFLHIGS